MNNTLSFRVIAMIYGINKSGKSTLASCFEKPLFVATEHGLTFIERKLTFPPMYAMEWEKLKGIPSSIKKRLKEIDENSDNPESLKPETLVLDTVDQGFILFKSNYVKENQGKYPGDFKWGIGWDRFNSEWRGFIADFLSVPTKNIIFISHQKIRGETDDEKIDLPDIMPCKLIYQSSAAFILNPLEFILYLDVDRNGNRKVYTKLSKQVMAGDRSGLLPSVIEVDEKYTQFFEALARLDEELEGK